jgi:hypothetical protein
MKSHRPCPRCLTPKVEFANLGVPEDQRRRRKLRRIDNQARNDKVAQARLIIYTDGRAVNSKGVESLMKPHSYVPTKVSSVCFARLKIAYILFLLERFLSPVAALRLRYF